jgi:hypothetical protein
MEFIEIDISTCKGALENLEAMLQEFKEKTECEPDPEFELRIRIFGTCDDTPCFDIGYYDADLEFHRIGRGELNPEHLSFAARTIVDFERQFPND